MPKVVFLIGAFPSPCGEKVGINYPYYGGLKISGYDREFPSPCGEKVGINGPFLRIVNGEFQGFPSPCGEKVGINDEVDEPICSVQWEGFRPLAGKR